MEALTMYLLKMLLCSGILFGYYRLALYNERFHQWNRFYLLAAMVLSVIVPLISIPVFAEEQPANVVVIIASMPWNASVSNASPSTTLSWQDALLIAIGIISLVLFLRIMLNVARLFITYKTNPVNSLDSKVQLVLTQLKHAPFSFFNWLFWRQDIDPASDNGQRMLTHELTHIREYHSMDKIFTEVLLCVFWMNPFFWLIRRELGTVHEFLADRRAIEQQDGAAFAAMILHALRVQPSTTSGLVNPLFSSTIKRRLQMITTSKEPRYSYVRRLSGLMLMIFSVVVLTLTIQQVKAQQRETMAEKKASGNQVKEDTTAKVHESKRVVTKPGELITVKIDSVTWKAAKGEAIGTTSSGEKVRIEVSKQEPSLGELPIRALKQDTATSGALRIGGLKVDPLFILNEKEITSEEFKAINPNTIESISVLKDGSAVTRYGDKGKNGVIIINSRKLTEVPVPSSRIDSIQKSQEPVVVRGYAQPRTRMITDTVKRLPGVEANTRNKKVLGEVIEVTKSLDKEMSNREVVHDKVFIRVEQPAQFPGGESGWKRYLTAQLHYPESALKAGTEGVARVQFIVDTKGNISNIRLLNNPGNGIGEEAVRLVSRGPKWQPAKQSGREVTYQVELPIEFKINKFF